MKQHESQAVLLHIRARTRALVEDLTRAQKSLMENRHLLSILKIDAEATARSVQPTISTLREFARELTRTKDE